MNFEIQKRSLQQLQRDAHDALVVIWPQNAATGQDLLSAWVNKAIKAGDFEHKTGSILQSYGMDGVKARRLVVVSCGDGKTADHKAAISAAWASLKGAKIQRLGLHWAGDVQPEQVQHAAVAVAEASYIYTTTLSKAKPRALAQVSLSAESVTAAHRHALDKGHASVAGIETAKEWANRPANHATPSDLASAARAIAKGPQMDCEVLGPKEVAKLGMGSFLAVAKGSAEPLRFIVMRYKGGKTQDAPVVLVGKGITFDTGGISMKPAAEMDEMKFDMSGAASVLGVFKSLSILRPHVNVVGLIPATENMPDGTAVKPGDVVTSMSGQTIEILNTDAEGRLVLCDALTYAERFKPRAVIDIATLTGACVIALGGVRSGLFASDDQLATDLQQAGEASGDLCWRMPLDDDYAEGLKTKFADVANVAGRAGGSITAAKFLQRFAKKYPWAHLDIAGTAWKSGAAKGATGRPVSLLLEYVTGQTAAPAAKKATTTRRRAA
jgi:leucyl aminopeptidase